MRSNYLIVFLLLGMVFCAQCAGFSQTNSENYIISFTPDSAVSDLNDLKIAQRHAVVQYFDGLGRLKQSVNVQHTPMFKDLIQPVFYDDFGRESKTYLPFAHNSSGELHTNPFDAENWQHHYAGENAYAFSEKGFDHSPLNRVVEQGAFGESWQVSGGHTIKTEYISNADNEVACYFIESNTLKQEGYYGKNQLYKTVSKNENWVPGNGKLYTTEEFKNKQGQVILKRSYVGSASLPTHVDTYYVYDDYALLRFVLPPRAVDMWINGSSISDQAEQFNQEKFNELIYAYKYDVRKRMIEKKLPGAEPVCMVYDDRDRLVATQDGNQREEVKWLVTKYDFFDRPVMTAFYSSSKNQRQLQDEVDDFYSNSLHPLYESRGGNFWSYDKKSFPINITDADVLSVSYYDNYSGIDNCPKSIFDDSFLSNTDVLSTPKGQLAATWVKSLNADTGKNSGLWTVNFYDEKYRVVQSYAENYLGGYDYTTNAYDFVGKVERTIHKHTTETTNITESKWFTYDHAGRMLKIEQQYTGSVNKAKVTIAEMEYDELGQLVGKNLPLVDRNLDYAYNIRGWMTQMNAVKAGSKSDFGFNLKYQWGATTFGGTNQFNGNIGAMEWWCSNLGDKNHRQAYGYQYDALNRITKADFREYSTSWVNPISTYDVDKITYDVNGNIQSLRRYGASTTIDDLAYTYSGNQLLSVNDSGDDHYGFKELSDSSLEYGYDANGNMISDANKKISNVDYNLLNLPEAITKESQSIAYAYSVTGEKLENRVSSSKKLQYCANFVYENGSLKYILNEEGKLDVGTTANYQFFIKDHLGNTRVVLAEGGSTVTEVNHYYPFGMRMDMANLPKDAYQKYLYNGKELQDETDWLDYGLRFYDPQLARWHSVDPAAELMQGWSPYNYCLGNPIIYEDKDGAIPIVGNIFAGVAGAAWEYGGQVYSNYQKGFTGSDAWVGQVDFADVVVEGVATGATMGTNKLVGAAITETVKAAVDINGSGEVAVVGAGKSAGEFTEQVLVGTASSYVGGKVAEKFTKKMGTVVQQALKDKGNAAKNLTKSINAVKNGNTRTKAALPSERLKEMQAADMKLQSAEALSTKVADANVDKATGTGAKSLFQSVIDYFREDEKN